MWSRAACASSGDRVRITAQLNDVWTGSHIWAERYRSISPMYSRCRTKSPRPIVAAIEPGGIPVSDAQAQAAGPASDAWDLVMRALSHYWRVTRQDNMVAQALLEKAIAIDPNYGHALSVFATSHMFSVHLGWADIATSAP